MAVEILVIYLGWLLVACNGQSSPVASNLYDSLQPLQCGQFLGILNKCSESVWRLYKDDVQWTVFAPNDTAFFNLPASRRNRLLNMTQQEAENYVMAFTLPKTLQTTYFQDNRPEQSRSPLNTKIFFTKRARRDGDSASGIAGPTEYYANGAMVLRPNIPAGHSVIHVIDRVLDMPSDKSALAYVRNGPDVDFFNEVITYIRRGDNYAATVELLNTAERLTVFVPTKQAIGRIPREKLDILRNNEALLTEVVKKHIVVDQVLYTSFVYHNEGVPSLGIGQIIFRTSTARESVYINSGGVVGEITYGNVTCKNGVVHYIDTLLGYKYNTAKDEIEINALTQTFEELMLLARNDLQQRIVNPSGVTIFVPVNKALENIPTYNNLAKNQSLINRIVELSMLELGQEFELTKVNGDYEARLSLVSAYFRRPIQVYSQGNETWIESGYVKARVIRPDVGVINGYLHLIDAVPGVPSRDVPNTIFCEDWLIKSSYQLSLTGLNDFMRDWRVSTIATCTKTGGVQTLADVYSAFKSGAQPETGAQQGKTPSSCGSSCRFTVFVPNGTAIDNFENMAAGRQIQEDPKRWKWVLQRHITRQEIYLDQISVGAERTYVALNGDSVRYRRATDRFAYLYFGGRQSRILHSDLGGTNGVVHIIDQVLFVTDDLTRTWFPSSVASESTPASLIVCILAAAVHLIAGLSH